MKNQMTSHWWWLDSQNNPKRSPWLQSALAELDEKTRAMLKLIEQDADSFARRAEMYYKKRPELISMVEDFYRAHRSLAERFDLLKSESGMHRLSILGSPLSSPIYRPEKLMSKLDQNSYNSYFGTYDTDDSAESEVEDPEPEDEVQVGEERERPKEENIIRKVQLFQKDDNETDNNEVMNLKKELEKLREQNMIQKEELSQKDEEKREVIRQLSLALEILKEDNLQLRKYITKESPKKWNHFDFTKLKGMFLGKFMGSPKFEGSVIAL